MDDLLGEDWQQKPASSTPANPAKIAAPAPITNAFRSTSQFSLSGNASPAALSRPSSTVNGISKPATPVNNDSFGNLLAPKPKSGTSTVSMQERQRQLLEERQRQQEQTSQLWDSLGSGRSTPALSHPAPPAQADDVDDILAAFNRDAPVDRASHFSPPPQSSRVSGTSTPASLHPTASASKQQFDDEDDPFGLAEAKKKGNGHTIAPTRAFEAQNDDDILGDLGKPVPVRTAEPTHNDDPMQERMLNEDGNSQVAESEMLDDGGQNTPADRQLAELVDMGFPADTARIALRETGGNVHNAVGWLLQQAHEESRQKARGETPSSRTRSPQVESRSPPRKSQQDRDAMPTWMRSQDSSRASSTARRREAGDGEKDASQVAQEFGTKMWKSANSLWKASQKQMAKTIADFQQDGGGTDPSQPKWMRDPSSDSNVQRQQQPSAPPRSRRMAADGVTDEAAALDGPREPSHASKRPTNATGEDPARGRSPAESLPQLRPQEPRFLHQAPRNADRHPVGKVSRQDVEDQSAQAYVSPARRKRPTPEPTAKPATEEVDLFTSAAASSTSQAKTVPPATSAARPTPSPRPPPAPSKPKAPPRVIPSVSAIALQSSASHRKTGGEHFKRGDFAAAHESYTAALNPLPQNHPIAIIVLSNRALTALKTGDAKTAVSDSDRALEIIGVGQGVGETIDTGGSETSKDMKEFYGKALMRKAEALEHMEKYRDAAAVWRQAVEAGVGGSVSLRGKDRCEKAASPKPAAASKAQSNPTRTPASKAAPARSLGNSQQRPTLPTPSSGEAVKKLREANAAATKEDDEKFALSDSVDAKLTAWKGGKTDNLRALLQSMDVVLWPEAGWKKVGMSDLVMPAKVKIVYMKAIGKVHPDKVSWYSHHTPRPFANRACAISDTTKCYHGATDDQCCGFQHAQRVVGQIQD